jgi:hypothetical protein
MDEIEKAYGDLEKTARRFRRLYREVVRLRGEDYDDDDGRVLDAIILVHRQFLAGVQDALKQMLVDAQDLPTGATP